MAALNKNNQTLLEKEPKNNMNQYEPIHHGLNVSNDIILTLEESSFSGYVLNIILLTMVVVLTILGIFLNSVTFVIVAKKMKKFSSKNLYILNLAVANLMICCIYLTATLISLIETEKSFGQSLCKLVLMIQGTLNTVTAGTTVIIALDRYFTIVKCLPTKKDKTTISIFIITSLWILGFMVNSPFLIFTKTDPTEFHNLFLYETCTERWPSEEFHIGFTLLFILIQFVTPILTISITNYKIFSYLSSHMKSLTNTPVHIQTPEIHIPPPNDSEVDDEVVEEEGNDELLNERRNSLYSENSNRSCEAYEMSDLSKKNTTDQKERLQLKKNKEILRNRKTKFFLTCNAVVFTVSSLPITIFKIVYSFNFSEYQNSEIMSNIYAVCQVLAMSSAVTNPILYVGFNTNFQEDFLKLFLCICKVCCIKFPNLEKKLKKKKPNQTFTLVHREDSVLEEQNPSNLNVNKRLTVVVVAQGFTNNEAETYEL